MRRRRFQTQVNEEIEINMTPMLDIVFIMLIFFIVTASFVNETGLSIQRPQSSTAEKKDSTSIPVAISADGQVHINKQAVDVQTIESIISQLKAENPKSTVMIQADKDASTGQLVRVMDKIRLGGIREIAIATDMSEK